MSIGISYSEIKAISLRFRNRIRKTKLFFYEQFNEQINFKLIINFNDKYIIISWKFIYTLTLSMIQHSQLKQEAKQPLQENNASSF